MSFPIIRTIKLADGPHHLWQVVEELPGRIERDITNTGSKLYTIVGNIVALLGLGSGVALIVISCIVAKSESTIAIGILFAGVILIALALYGRSITELPQKRAERRLRLTLSNNMLINSSHPIYRTIMSPDFIEYLMVSSSEGLRQELDRYYLEALVVYENSWQMNREYTRITSIERDYRRDQKILETAISFREAISLYYDVADLDQFWAKRRVEIEDGYRATLRRTRHQLQQELDEVDEMFDATNP